MPTLILPIQADGALVDVELGWSASSIRAARQAGRPIPPPIQVQAMIDTGAETTCIDTAIVAQLSLPFGGMTTANAPALGGLNFFVEHDAAVRIIHPSGNRALDAVFPDLLTLELDLGTVGYQALLGRDVLALWDFLYQGPAGQFQLNY